MGKLYFNQVCVLAIFKKWCCIWILHPVGSHDSLHQMSTLTSSTQNENQQKHGDHNDKSLLDKTEVVSKLVYGNNIETDIEQEPQNQIAVQELSQTETVKPTEKVLPHSSPSSTVKGNV